MLKGLALLSAGAAFGNAFSTYMEWIPTSAAWEAVWSIIAGTNALVVYNLLVRR